MTSISCCALCILCLRFCSILADLKEPVVRVQQGLVRGRFFDTLDGRRFYGFLGIPFAKPPLGNLRFKPPEQPDSWNGTLNATTYGAKCPQMGPSYNKYEGDEDCLTLNVVCHSLTPGKKLPVLVNIHGGALQLGSANDLPPNRLMTYGNIVIVSIQYRLLSLGFLSTNDSAASGNYGLLDQILALQWVQRNIDTFGGDPKKVTVIGGSAGAISIGFHMVAPSAKGLFRGAYLVSGSPLMNVNVQTDPLSVAKSLGNMVGCHSSDNSALVSCLRGKPVKQLTETIIGLIVSTGQLFPFPPVIENRGTCKYLCDYPEELFKQGKFHKVISVSGTTKDEMASAILLFPMLQDLKQSSVLTNAMVDNFFKDRLPTLLRLLLKYENNLQNLSLAVRRKYESEYNFTETKSLFQFLIDASTDATYRRGADNLTRYLAPKVPTYLYSFEYHGDLNNTITNFGDKEVDHAISGVYYHLPPPYTARDAKMSDILVAHLINFVINLNPNSKGCKFPRWTPTPNVRQLRYFRYGDDKNGMETGLRTDKMEFWDKDAPRIALGIV